MSLNIIHSISCVYVDTTDSVLFRDLHRLCPRTMFCNCKFYTKAGNEYHLPTCGLCYGRYNIIWTLRINKNNLLSYHQGCISRINYPSNKLSFIRRVLNKSRMRNSLGQRHVAVSCVIFRGFSLDFLSYIFDVLNIL